MNRILTTLLIICFSLSLNAEDRVYTPVEGSIHVWGDFTESKLNRDLKGFSLFLHGQSAEKMYKSIEEKATFNECYGDGTFTKYKGHMECSYSTNKIYSCKLGIDLNNNTVSRAESC